MHTELEQLLERAPPTDEAEARTRRGGYWGVTVKIEYANGDVLNQGSGVLLTADGYVLTNHHVLSRREPEATVVFHGDKRDDEVYRVPLETALCKHSTNDVMLARLAMPRRLRARLGATMPNVYLAAEAPTLGDPVRVYGFKHEVVEERVGAVVERGSFNRRGEELFLTNRVVPTSAAPLGHAWVTTAVTERGFSGGPVVRASTGELLGLTVGSAATSVGSHIYTDSSAVRQVITAYLAAGLTRPPRRRWWHFFRRQIN